ncbi:uncharacterized protein LOC117337712 [Pecten maximus]|uniref:uncharacterized protein LOC117337712 n=1 Tax=Pecten maximus TaxID=6579 RepID=UPI001458F09C|nr:uncharacterized protein LOC117337712 [Pecten maximus]
MNLNRPGRLCCNWLLTFVLMFVTTEVTEGCSNLTHHCLNRTVRTYDFLAMNGSIITRLPGKNYYTSGMECEWYLDAGANGRVKLTFVKVDLRPENHDEKCSEQDHLKIKNSLGRYTRQVCPGVHAEQFISIGRGTYVTFQSDKREQGFHHKGIEIRYEMFEPGKRKCPPGWVCGPENHDGTCSCYYVMSGPSSMVDFQTAQKFCGFSNANLVKIDSARMHRFIQGLVLKYSNVAYFWIGLNDIEKEGTFDWIDRSSLFFGNGGKDNSLTKNCVIQERFTGSWITVSCNEHHLYICEIFSSTV